MGLAPKSIGWSIPPLLGRATCPGGVAGRLVLADQRSGGSHTPFRRALPSSQPCSGPGTGSPLGSVTPPCRDQGKVRLHPLAARQQATLRNRTGLPRHSRRVPNKAEATSSAVWGEVRVVSPGQRGSAPLPWAPE